MTINNQDTKESGLEIQVIHLITTIAAFPAVGKRKGSRLPLTYGQDTEAGKKVN